MYAFLTSKVQVHSLTSGSFCVFDRLAMRQDVCYIISLCKLQKIKTTKQTQAAFKLHMACHAICNKIGNVKGRHRGKDAEGASSRRHGCSYRQTESRVGTWFHQMVIDRRRTGKHMPAAAVYLARSRHVYKQVRTQRQVSANTWTANVLESKERKATRFWGLEEPRRARNLELGLLEKSSLCAQLGDSSFA